MKLIYNLIIVLGIFTSISCEKIIEIDIPEREKKMVLNGLAKSDSTDFYVNLSQSISILELDENVQKINDASIQLLQNGVLVGNMLPIGNGSYKIENIHFQTQKPYSLVVNHPNKQSISAEFQFPKKADFKLVDTSYITRTDYGYSFSMFAFEIEINDDPTMKNFYRISIAQRYTYFILNNNGDTIWYVGENKLPLSINDQQTNMIVSETDYYSLVFSDELFDGKKYRMFFNAEADLLSYPDETPTTIIVEQITEDFYKYEVTYANYFYSKDNFLSQPVIVHNNVSNGFGMVGALSQADTTFLLQTNYTVPTFKK